MTIELVTTTASCAFLAIIVLIAGLAIAILHHGWVAIRWRRTVAALVILLACLVAAPSLLTPDEALLASVLQRLSCTVAMLLALNVLNWPWQLQWKIGLFEPLRALLHTPTRVSIPMPGFMGGHRRPVMAGDR